MIHLQSVFKILFLSLVLMLIGIYADKAIDQEHEPPAPPSVNSGEVEPIPPPEAAPAPQEGIGALIGQPVEQLTALLGSPVRKDPSPYGYEWWVFKGDAFYVMAGVEQNRVVTAFVKGSVNTDPFTIGGSAQEIFQTKYPEPEVIAETVQGRYRFELSEEELNMRPLLPVGSFYAQLYINQQTNELSAVRFLTVDVLLAMRPYELVYDGVLPEQEQIGRSQWIHINRASVSQLTDLSNYERSQKGIAPAVVSTELSEVAAAHSLDMFSAGFFSDESPSSGDLDERLAGTSYEAVEAEEWISMNYVDAPAAFEAWLNERDASSALLSDVYSEIGAGAFRSHFTQIFAASPDDVIK